MKRLKEFYTLIIFIIIIFIFTYLNPYDNFYKIGKYFFLYYVFVFILLHFLLSINNITINIIFTILISIFYLFYIKILHNNGVKINFNNKILNFFIDLYPITYFCLIYPIIFSILNKIFLKIKIKNIILKLIFNFFVFIVLYVFIWIFDTLIFYSDKEVLMDIIFEELLFIYSIYLLYNKNQIYLFGYTKKFFSKINRRSSKYYNSSRLTTILIILNILIYIFVFFKYYYFSNSSIFKHMDFKNILFYQKNGIMIFFLLLINMLLAEGLEEIYFRYYLYKDLKYLENYYDSYFFYRNKIIIISLFFALMHLINLDIKESFIVLNIIIIILSHFFSSLILFYFKQRMISLKGPLLIHNLLNIILLIFTKNPITILFK